MHGIHFMSCFLPFRVRSRLRQNTASGIKNGLSAGQVHAPQVDIQGRISLWVDPSDDARIIAAVVSFVFGNEGTGFLLGEAADGRGRMQFLQDVSQVVGTLQLETEVGL